MSSDKYKKSFEWTPKMTLISVIIGLLIGVGDLSDRIYSRVKGPIVQEIKVQTLSDAQNIATVQITSFIKENTAAHDQIQGKLTAFQLEVEGKLSKTNENLAYMRGILDRAFPTTSNSTSWLVPNQKEAETK
jgi:hypothetical protein